MANEPTLIEVSDPLMNITRKPASIDASTVSRQLHKTIPSTAASASQDVGLAGQQSTIQLGIPPYSRMRWDRSYLAVQLGFYAADGAHNPITTACSVPWNLFATLIQEISIAINDIPVWTRNQGNYLPTWTAHMLRKYNLDQLNMHPAVFGPVDGDTVYLRKFADIPVANPLTLGTSNAAEKCRIVYGAGPPKTYTLTEGAAPALPDAKFTPSAASGTAGAQARYEHYIKPAMPYTVMVPLSDLGVDIIGTPINLKSMTLSIKWSPTKNDKLEYLSTDAAGIVQILSCYVMQDFYAMQPDTSAGTVVDKGTGAADIITFITPEIFIPSSEWQGNPIDMPAIRSLDSMMILSFAAETKNIAAGANYTSWGQFQLPGMLASGHANLFKTSAMTQDSLIADGITYNVGKPPYSVSMNYGGIQYPESDLQIASTLDGSFDCTTLYMEMQRAMDRLGSTITEAPLDYRTFRTVMPFIYLKPWSSNGIHRSDPRTLTLRLMPSSGNVPFDSNCHHTKMYICQFHAEQFRINVGSVDKLVI